MKLKIGDTVQASYEGKQHDCKVTKIYTLSPNPSAGRKNPIEEYRIDCESLQTYVLETEVVQVGDRVIANKEIA